MLQSYISATIKGIWRGKEDFFFLMGRGCNNSPYLKVSINPVQLHPSRKSQGH